MEKNKERVMDLLELYNGNPIKTKPLCAVLNITSRELQQTIHDLRMDGVKVCSGSKGYWIWNGKDDSWSHTKNQIKSRIKELSKMYTAMNGVQLDGQQEMTLEEKEHKWRDALMNL